MNHTWTDEEREIVRRDYKGSRKSAEEIASRLGVSRYGVIGQAQKMGLMVQKSPPWTERELSLLEELIHRKSITQIAKRLNRSPNAVCVRAKRLKLSLRIREDWFTEAEVCEILGVDHKKAQRWIDSKALKASPHTEVQPQKDGSAKWHIEATDLRKFIINYSSELLGRNCDIQQIVWLLTDYDDTRVEGE